MEIDMKIKQSIVYPMIKPKDMPLEDLLKAGKQIGYDAVEIWGREATFEEEMELARKYGFQVASMVGHWSHADGLSRYDQHDRVEAELRESIDIAVKYGIPGVIALSGNRNPGQTDIEGMVVCAHGLRRIAPYAEEKGVNINIELLNSKVDHHWYLCDHMDWAVALCEMVNSPRVKILCDIYHMQIMEGDVSRTIKKYIQYIGHFHTAGNPGRNDMDDTQEMNYAGVCKAIASTDYSLYVGHEFMPKGDPIKALKDTYKMCNHG
jgi:hydroxypyruvate isomerase